MDALGHNEVISTPRGEPTPELVNFMSEVRAKVYRV
jgi:hypothetical protein